MQRAGKGTAEGLHGTDRRPMGTSALNRLLAQEASIERHLRNESPVVSRRQQILGALQKAFNAQPGLKVRRMGAEEALRDGKPGTRRGHLKHINEILGG